MADAAAGREPVGTVVRLQVQRSPLKPGPPLGRRYLTEPLAQVTALRVEPRGVRGLTAGGELPDVHHADHPQSRNTRLVNGLSVMSLGDYAYLRSRYGPHLADGTAGESLLLDTPGRLQLTGSFVLDTVDGGLLHLTGAMVASPCVEFTRFVLGRDDGEVDDEIRVALAALDGGARGHYLTASGEGRVEVGARLWPA